jgi:hypothetical protein
MYKLSVVDDSKSVEEEEELSGSYFREEMQKVAL